MCLLGLMTFSPSNESGSEKTQVEMVTQSRHNKQLFQVIPFPDPQPQSPISC